jgi:F-box and leucine-rich repeat protein GRR1
VQAFLREELIVYCREAPPGRPTLDPDMPIPPYLLALLEFTDHQRDVFCVFSGLGVQRLRNYLNSQTGTTVPGYAQHGGTDLFDDPEEPDVVLDVTAQAGGMTMEELDDPSELLAGDEPGQF